MPAYTIASVDREKPWEGNYGPRIDYTCTLRDQAGTEHKSVVVTQKPETAKPTVGQTLNGTIEPGNFGPKFKKEQQQGYGGGRSRDPKETAAIHRQASQRTAVMFLQAKVTAGAVTADNFPSMDEFRKAVDWFERDIQNNAPPYAQPKIREPQRTSQSDVPSDASEFIHPPVDDAGLPFTGAPA